MKTLTKIIIYPIIAIIGLLLVVSIFVEDPNDKPYPPSIDWSQYAPYKKIGVEKSISEQSCIGLQRAHDASKKAEMMHYIHWHLNHFGCYN